MYVIRRDELLLDQRAFAQGAGGQVFRGTYNGTVVAAKAVFSQTLAADIDEFSREVKMLAALHHPNIVTFYGVSSDYANIPETVSDSPNPLAAETLFIVEEFCAGGSLELFSTGLLASSGGVSESAGGTAVLAALERYTPALMARIVTELFAAVRYMHAQGIAHRDLKPAK